MASVHSRNTIKLTKHMTQDQKDAVNKIYYSALARKYAASFAYALALKKDGDGDGDTDQVHKDCLDTFVEFYAFEIKHKQMLKLIQIEAMPCCDQWVTHYYCCCGVEWVAMMDIEKHKVKMNISAMSADPALLMKFIRVYAEALSEGELASMLERANAAAISGSISATTKLEEQVTAKIQSYRMGNRNGQQTGAAK